MSQRKFFGAGIFFIIVGVLVVVLTQFSCAPDFERLTRVQGIIRGVQFAEARSKVSAKIVFVLQSNQGELEIHAEDPTPKRPEVRSLRTGDFVEAWIVKDNFWRGFYWAWQLERNSRTLFSYRDMIDIEGEQKGRARNIIGYGACGIGLILLSASFFRKEIPWKTIIDRIGGKLTNCSAREMGKQ